ncbi:MAG: ABC transporter ATP-binding protein, partial [Variovorax sp.]|nr:ABC transporter ATP-binding protein [Variovorax sp.]
MAVDKRYGAFAAVQDLSFNVRQGSFFSILGPSGCGKTTLLRMIAGFIAPDRGELRIKGTSMLGVPPNRRPVNMVFQHLALFPMMSVGENIAYGLARRGLKGPVKAGKARRIRRGHHARIGAADSGDRRRGLQAHVILPQLAGLIHNRAHRPPHNIIERPPLALARIKNVFRDQDLGIRPQDQHRLVIEEQLHFPRPRLHGVHRKEIGAELGCGGLARDMTNARRALDKGHLSNG